MSIDVSTAGVYRVKSYGAYADNYEGWHVNRRTNRAEEPQEYSVPLGLICRDSGPYDYHHNKWTVWIAPGTTDELLTGHVEGRQLGQGFPNYYEALGALLAYAGVQPPLYPNPYAEWEKYPKQYPYNLKAPTYALLRAHRAIDAASTYSATRQPPTEQPEFPTYYDSQGREHEEF